MTESLCTVYLAGHWWALPTQDVREVVPTPPITPVPDAHRWITGLVNLRGDVIAVVDATGYVTNRPDRVRTAPWLLVVDAHPESFAVLIDEFGGVFTPPSTLLTPPPGTVPERLQSAVRGILDTDSHLLYVVDVIGLVKELTA